MQVLILEDDQVFQAQLAQAMIGKGFNVLCVETVPAAEAFLRLDMADVVIAGERIDGRLTHPVALLAECRNPLVAAVLLTERTGPDLDELFDLMPSLVGVLGRRVSPAVVSQVVMAAVAGMASDTVRGRLAARWAAAERADPVNAADLPAEITAAMAADLPADTPDDTVEQVARAAPLPAVRLRTEPAPPDAPADAPAATLAFATGWDGLWQAEVAALVAPPPVTEPVAPAPLPTLQLGAPLPAESPRPMAAPLPVARPAIKPSPDSPLARVLAAGHRALAAPVQPAVPAVAPPRPAGLPSWLTQPQNSASGAPAAPPPPPVRPIPAQPAGRRLHLA